jgi:glycosyltransferase involved in cell wall biosynthesis
MPRISVILPIFNAQRYLSAAVDSILTQTFEDFELLLFDDGSEDQSLEIAKEATARDSRVILMHGDHRGYVSWLNTGLEMAKGELIARMDADDISLPERFARQVQFLDSQRECSVVGTHATRIDPDGSPIDSWKMPERHEQIDQQHINGRPGALIHPSVMMRNSALVQIGGYRVAFEPAEDYDLFLRLAEVGRLANLPEPLLKYRLHDRCVTFVRAQAQGQHSRKALEEAFARRRLDGPLPPPLDIYVTPSTEELIWDWARSAFAARNFCTARKQALRLLRRCPSEFRRWVLFGAACSGPLAVHLRRICCYRVGSYQSPSTGAFS